MRALSVLVLFGIAFLSAGCAGAYLPPLVSVPALRRAGQATLSANARLFAPQLGAHAHAAVAVTERVRVAGSISGAFDRDRRQGIYGEALAGAEPMLTRGLQLGVLGGVGYGEVSAKHSACGDEDMCISTAPRSAVEQVQADYVRYSLQAQLTYHAPLIVHAGGGLRVSLLDMRVNEVEEAIAHARGLPVAIEPFAFARAGWPFLQGEWQVRYTGVVNSPRVRGERVVVSDQVTFVLGLRMVFGPGITKTLVARQPEALTRAGRMPVLAADCCGMPARTRSGLCGPLVATPP